MGKRQEKFRFRLNLFDSIVIVLALAVGAYLLWNALKPDNSTPAEQVETSTVRYTICFQRWIAGTSSAIKDNARLTDSIRTYEMGNVVAVEARPASEQIVDHNNKRYVQAEIPGYEDVFVTVEAPGVIDKEAVTLSSGYVPRVGLRAYVQGDGFLASGYIYSIERGEG